MVFSDVGVMLFFFFLTLAYPVIYTLIYNPETVKDVPVVVVDEARTPESRDLTRMIDATDAIKIYDYASNMEEARRMKYEHKAFGILLIPSNYSKNLNRGEQGVVTFYSDMGLLLRFRGFVAALTDVQLAAGAKIQQQKIGELGLAGDAVTGKPINTEAIMLGDPTQGFASFIMPGIVVLILQQSMILGICLIAGTAAERRRRSDLLTDRLDFEAAPMATVLGKALAYVVFYIPATIYILHYVPVWFNLPHQGDALQWLLFIVPFLTASAMFGLMLSHLMRTREDCFIYIVFTSVVFLFLSGLTWPRFAMPAFWYAIADTVPATWGVEGFVRINSNASTLAEQSVPYTWLWGLTVAYFAAAVILQRLSRRRVRLASAI